MDDWREARQRTERDLRLPVLLVASMPFVFALCAITGALADSVVPIVASLVVMLLQGIVAIHLGIRAVRRDRVPAARVVRR